MQTKSKIHKINHVKNKTRYNAKKCIDEENPDCIMHGPTM